MDIRKVEIYCMIDGEYCSEITEVNYDRYASDDDFDESMLSLSEQYSKSLVSKAHRNLIEEYGWRYETS